MPVNKIDIKYFYEIFDNYYLDIPKLQRDYAQGRESEKEVRDTFLSELKAALETKKTNTLDFIYGDVNEGDKSLILLDGQQRITTLFLLHWFLAVCSTSSNQDNYSDFTSYLLENGKSKFSYDTRESAKDFCTALVMNGREFVPDEDMHTFTFTGVLSEEIKNKNWFYMNWINDSTVKAMLNMLDSMQVYFPLNKSVEYYEALRMEKDGEGNFIKEPNIMFNFMKLSDYHLTDELYIKMNSRGRSLTRFENLKSKILTYYSTLKDEKIISDKLPEIKLKETQSLRDYFSFKLDTDWTDSFWNFMLENESQFANDDSEEDIFNDTEIIDKMILSFLSVFFINEAVSIIMHKENKDEEYDKTTDLNEVESLIKAEDKIPFDKYIEILNENPDTAYNLIKILNSICKNKQICSYLTSKTYLDEKKLFNEVTKDFKASREIRLKFYAYTRYMLKYPDVPLDDERFSNWIRFICNIISNSTDNFNHAIDFYNSFVAVERLCKKNIYSSINESFDFAGLNRDQFDEEKLKINLMKHESWKNEILYAESFLPYLKGQIRYLLSFSDNTLLFSDSENQVLRMRDCSLKLQSLFDEKGLKEEYETRFIRALLTKGDYTKKKNNEAYSLLVNKGGGDYTWKKYLRDGVNTEYLNALLEELELTDIEQSLNNIIKNYKASTCPYTLSNWRDAFINFDELLNDSNFGEDRFIYKDNRDGKKTVYPMTSNKISASHGEINSLCMFYYLKNNLEIDKVIKPKFKKIYYHRIGGKDLTPCIYLDWNGERYAMAIYYILSKQTFSFRFFYRYNREGHKNPIKKEVVDCLKENKFTRIPDKESTFTFDEYELINIHPNDVKKTFEKICLSLNK